MDVLQHNIAEAQSYYCMSILRHHSLESHSKNHQCKHVWSTNITCPEITMVVRTYVSGLCSNDVCSESKLKSDRFRAQT